LVEKWIPPSRLKTAEIGQKTEGVLGVNERMDWHGRVCATQENFGEI
jgi:hypothetical protein